jgi:hypothetical protein
MFFGEIYDSIRGRIDCRQKIKPKSDRLLAEDLLAKTNPHAEPAPAQEHQADATRATGTHLRSDPHP